MKLIKIGAKIISHSRMTIFQMAEVAVPERLFRSMLSRIHRLGKARARAQFGVENTGQLSPDNGKPGGLEVK